MTGGLRPDKAPALPLKAARPGKPQNLALGPAAGDLGKVLWLPGRFPGKTA